MNLAFHQPMSLTEFLAWEDRESLRHEFDGVKTIAMTGGTAAHAIIERNLVLAIGGRLRGKRCQFYGTNLKIEVHGRIRYPDGFVACSPVRPKDKVVREPVVIFEVLSESTAEIDIVQKNREYAATPSVKRYVILSQDAVGGTMFERVEGDWVGHLLAADAVLRMPEIDVEVPLADLYDGLDFSIGDEATSAPSP